MVDVEGGKSARPFTETSYLLSADTGQWRNFPMRTIAVLASCGT